MRIAAFNIIRYDEILSQCASLFRFIIICTADTLTEEAVFACVSCMHQAEGN